MKNVKNILTISLMMICFSNYGQQQKRLDSLEHVLTNISGKEKVNALNELGSGYAFISLEKAEKYSFLGLNESREINFNEGTIQALVNVGFSHMDHYAMDSAKYYFNEALSLAESISNDEQKAKCYNALGIVYKKTSNYPEALKYYKQALYIQEKLDNTNGQSSLFNNLGKLLLEIGDYNNALEYLLEALKLNREYNYDYKVVGNLMNIALVNTYQDELEQAKEYLNEAKSNDLLNSRQKVALFNDFGTIAKKEGDFDSALHYFNKSMELSLDLDMKPAIQLHNLAETYYDMGNYELALNISGSALKLKEEIGNYSSQLFTLNLQTQIYLSLNQLGKALEVGEKALSISIEKGIKDRRVQSLKYLSDVYAARNEHGRAWALRLEYEQRHDSIFNAEKARQQAVLLALYETEKQQKTIELQQTSLDVQRSEIAQQSFKQWVLIGMIILFSILIFIAQRGWSRQKKFNEELASKNLTIGQKNAENETLLKEIHHRVKNNLQIISSILNIQSRKLEDPSAKRVVSEGRSRIKSMSLIHEKLYSNDHLSEINMKEYIQELSDFLFKTYGSSSKVERSVKVDGIKLDIDIAIPVGLILNELVSNALKYAFNENEKGRLNISLVKDDASCLLTVRDSGRGLPKDFENLKNMGMRLVNSLTEQIGGTLNIKKHPGAEFILKFKSG
ncbi:MAG: tetratricopeptide repeat protein [Bacteroidota bacterium]